MVDERIGFGLVWHGIAVWAQMIVSACVCRIKDPFIKDQLEMMKEYDE